MAGSLPLSRAFPARRFATVALLAWLTAACGYPNVALKPPERPTVPRDQSPVAAGESGQTGESAGAPGGEFGLGAPFVVIRFGPEPADFEAPLAEAITEALARRPDVKFHLLAVAAREDSPVGREAALGHAEAVLRSLAALGVPPGEVFVAAVAAPQRRIDEVRLYLR